MLYDEEGKAYVEPPLLPENVHLQYIVKDYQRMFREHGRMESVNAKLRKKNAELGKVNYWMKSEIKEQQEIIRHCVRYMKKCGVEPSTHLTEWLERKNIK